MIFTGKGGVGKSTISFAIAQKLSHQKKKTLIIDLNSSGTKGKFFTNNLLNGKISKIDNYLFGINLQPKECLVEFITDTLKFKALSNLVVNNSVLGYFFRATPGLDELMMLWKMLNITQNENFDHYIIDAPATGHGLTLLKVPFVFNEIFSFGKLSKMTREITELFENHDTTEIILVAIPEELPFSETVELFEKLATFEKMNISGIILNKYFNSLKIKNINIFREFEKACENSEKSEKYQAFLSIYEFFISKYSKSLKYEKKFMEVLKTKIITIPLLLYRTETEIINEMLNLELTNV